MTGRTVSYHRLKHRAQQQRRFSRRRASSFPSTRTPQRAPPPLALSCSFTQSSPTMPFSAGRALMPQILTGHPRDQHKERLMTCGITFCCHTSLENVCPSVVPRSKAGCWRSRSSPTSSKCRANTLADAGKSSCVACDHGFPACTMRAAAFDEEFEPAVSRRAISKGDTGPQPRTVQ